MAELSKGKGNLKEREFDKKIFETSDSGDAKYISSDEESFISASFAKGDHVQDTNTFHTTAPVMYQLKLMQDEIDNLREELNNRILLLDGGNFFQGNHLGVVDSGRTMIEWMNKVGYQAMVPGNYDFLFGLDNLINLSKDANFSF